jgi:hypothetical protein
MNVTLCGGLDMDLSLVCHKDSPPVRSAVAARGSVPASNAGFKATSPTA